MAALLKHLSVFAAAVAILWPHVSGAGQAITPVVPAVARPLPLSAVRLTGGPLRNAQELNAQYLLALVPDRMLAGYRIRAGLEPKAEGYGGWDSVEGKQLTGHIGGHYLSAVSLMYAATGDARFKERADYIVTELTEVQDKNGDGYLGALANGRERFAEVAQGNIRSGGFDLNGLWSPWYVLHKTYAGLRDAYRYTGNANALELEIKFAAWAERILSGLDEAQVQQMLNTEFGGMNEIFADLYADTGDKRWLNLSNKFEHRAFTEPLKRHQDNLAGTHGNTQIPKMLGSLVRFGYVGDAGDGFAAGFFWDRVVQHHSYATGGHGKDEYFSEPDKLSDRVDGRTCETCNVYNMLKMTRALFALRPDAHYADFHERALFNHILASQDPQDGRVCYMVPVGRGVQHEYERNMLDGGFTCCVGSSMESHALHGDGLFYESGDQLWVNLYAPSTANWQAAGVQLTMETDFPEGESVKIDLAMAAPKEFTIMLRRPFWAGTNLSVSINGEAIAPELLALPGQRPSSGRRTPVRMPDTSSFVELRRTWKSGDQIMVTLPKTLRLEALPDNPRRVALLWGPLVLAGDLGPEQRGRGSWAEAAPVFVSAERPVKDWLKPVPDKPGSFRSDGVGKDRDVTFVPFYRLHRRTYAVYWDLFTPAEWEQRSVELAAEREKQRQLEAATIAYVQPGEMQAERDANMRGEDTEPVRMQGRPGRRARNWFSFDMSVVPAQPLALVVTYNHDEWQERTFEILVDGVRVGQQRIERRGPMRFFDVQYAVPAEVVRGKEKVTVRFQATHGNEVGAVYGIRMIRTGTDPDEQAPAAGSVQPLPGAVRERLELSPFYQKQLEVDGFPIIGSSNVSHFALLEAGWIVRKMLDGREDILRALKTNRVRLAVMAWNEFTTDLPEHSDLTPKAFWDRRARGLGATAARPAVSCAEENLLCYPGDPYSTENILIHEFAHTIHQMALSQLDPTFDQRLKAAFQAAAQRGLWKDTYAGSNNAEYWAEGVQAWFDNNRENDSLHNHVNTRAELQEYDPGLAALCFEVFGDNPWRYRKPAERNPVDQAHLAGFDSAKAPRFIWREPPVVVAPTTFANSNTVSARGPLRVHPDNPRYFTDGTKTKDGSLKAVYLTGSHHWNNLQDSGRIGGPITNRFDYDGYLERLGGWNHNLIRLWAWEGPAWWYQGGQNDNRYEPLPWARSSPSNALDGKPRFDLDQFNEDYFKRLRSRVITARDKGIYVSIMLFQGWSIYSHGYGNPWPGHPFNIANNANGLNGDPNNDGEGKEVHTLAVPSVTRRQEAYVRKVIDTVNDLDNVLYEITNETAIWSKDWQYHFIRFIKEYEATKPKQHPVGITAFDSGREGSMDALFGSPADWISPQNDGASGNYQDDPPAADGRKIIISDTDHLWGVGGDFVWVWKSFTRGHHPIYMDPLRKEEWFSIDERAMELARKAMGYTRSFSERVSLHAMVPDTTLSSTKYALAAPGKEYIVFQPGKGPFQLALPEGVFKIEWFDPATGQSALADSIQSTGKKLRFAPPWDSPAVLYLISADGK